MSSPSSSNEATHHDLDVHIAHSADSACLLKLVSVFHSRGVAVTDLHFSTLPDESRRLSAGFRSSAAKATTLARSLRRVLHVTDVVTRSCL